MCIQLKIILQNLACMQLKHHQNDHETLWIKSYNFLPSNNFAYTSEVSTFMMVKRELRWSESMSTGLERIKGRANDGWPDRGRGETTYSGFDMERNGAVEVTFSWRSIEASLVVDISYQWCRPCKGCKGRNWLSENITETAQRWGMGFSWYQHPFSVVWQRGMSTMAILVLAMRGKRRKKFRAWQKYVVYAPLKMPIYPWFRS
jgi:hypothetical protein